MTTPERPWFFYVARCSDGSLYSGVCVDLEQRFAAHNAGRGARYTRSRLPVSLAYHEQHATQSLALKREAEVKKWPRQRKEQLIRPLDETDQ